MPNKSRHHSRFERLSDRLHARRFSVAALSGLVVGGCGFFVDHMVHSANRLVASDFYTCVVAAVFTYVLLQFEARRRAQLARRMEIAAEVNHHIRNALTGVVYTAAVRNDPALHAVLRDATDRIDWVLNTVLPDGASDLKWPVQIPAWNPHVWAATVDQTITPDDAPEEHAPRHTMPRAIAEE